MLKESETLSPTGHAHKSELGGKYLPFGLAKALVADIAEHAQGEGED